MHGWLSRDRVQPFQFQRRERDIEKGDWQESPEGLGVQDGKPNSSTTTKSISSDVWNETPTRPALEEPAAPPTTELEEASDGSSSSGDWNVRNPKLAVQQLAAYFWDHHKHPNDRRRTFELSLTYTSFANLTRTSQRCFFVSSFRATQGHAKVSPCIAYSAVFNLNPDTTVWLPRPDHVHVRRRLVLSYNDINFHCLKVDMWSLSCWTFNTYFGSQKTSLRHLAENNVETIMLQKQLPKVQRKRQGAVAPHVCQLYVNVVFEEVFDFSLSCDNWKFELSPDHEEYRKRVRESKKLTFVMPTSRYSEPLLYKRARSRTHKLFTDWKEDFYWRHPGTAVFTGTSSDLMNSYFVVIVYSSLVSKAEKWNVVKGAAKRVRDLQRRFGSTLLNLTSVLDVSVFSGLVKQLTAKQANFVCGKVSGYLRCDTVSHHVFLDDENVERPQRAMTLRHAGTLPRGQYLVLIIRRALNLPATAIANSCDPFIRVAWDNIVQQTAIVKDTVNPTFNSIFYFTVRAAHPDVFSKSKFRRTALRYELEHKGPVKITVWDDDSGVSANYVAGYSMGLHDLINPELRTVKRNLLGSMPHETLDSKNWYEVFETTRVFPTLPQPLQTSVKYVNTSPTLDFEAFFYPDWPAEVTIEERPTESREKTHWEAVQMTWAEENTKFLVSYFTSFPDAIGAIPGNISRRFLAFAMDGEACVPLTHFVQPIVVPLKYSQPAHLLHWIGGIGFEISSQQESTGLIPEQGWKEPETVLTKRKGTIQDHAILLCCVLLSLKKDAYVCKGIVRDSQSGLMAEHVWVMHREVVRSEGWVVFWEPMTRRTYHLPRRWTPGEAKIKKTRASSDLRDGTTQGTPSVATLPLRGLSHSQVTGFEEDAFVNIDDFDDSSLATVVLKKPRAKQRSDRRRHLEKDDVGSIRFAPNPALLKPKTIVNWLPYETIEVVFNDKHLWANRQNHHPAAIMYDLRGSTCAGNAAWQPLPSPDVLGLPQVPSVSVRRQKDKREADMQGDRVVDEVYESLRLARQHLGLETLHDKRPELTEHLQRFLAIEELRMLLDPNVVEVPESPSKATTSSDGIAKRPRNVFSGNPDYADYCAQQEKARRTYEENLLSFNDDLKALPVRRGYCFKGIPVHFNTVDVAAVREGLSNLQDYKMMAERSDPFERQVYFTVTCSVFPLLAGASSVWLYVGQQVPNYRQSA